MLCSSVLLEWRVKTLVSRQTSDMTLNPLYFHHNTVYTLSLILRLSAHYTDHTLRSVWLPTMPSSSLLKRAISRVSLSHEAQPAAALPLQAPHTSNLLD